MIRILLLLIALLACVRANDAGGGAPGVGANVTVTTTATTATLDNGVIQAVIEKATGRVTSYKLNGFQMVDPANPIYYSMDGGADFDVPSGCVYSLISSSSDHVEISCKRTWNASAGYRHNFDIDLRYVLRRGDTGLYAFAILDHPASYPAASVGEWRIVWKLPRDSTTFTFERAYVDDLRNWEMPSVFDYQNASPLEPMKVQFASMVMLGWWVEVVMAAPLVLSMLPPRILKSLSPPVASLVFAAGTIAQITP